MLALSRRALLALGAAGLLLPRRASADLPTSARKLIVVFCPGGWDPTFVFAPVFSESIDHFVDDAPAEQGGIPFTDSPSRPSVRTFLERWASRTCFINGLQVPSIAHDVCTRWMLTGDSTGAGDDWVSIVAGNADPGLLMPNVHLSGPLFTSQYSSASVRVGLAGQLPALLDGSALARSNRLVTAPRSALEGLEDAWVRDQDAHFLAVAGPGAPARIAAAEVLAQERSAGLVGVAGLLDSLSGADLSGQLGVVARCLADGLSRTGIVSVGVTDREWDTHSANNDQDHKFDALFGALDELCTTLEASPGATEPTLLDETVILVCSEMGRTPHVNSSGGKDHWTFTSAVLIGAGVRGGQAIGGWTDSLVGKPISLDSGAPLDGGVILGPGHLGATVLQLLDLDAAEFVDPAAGVAISAVG